MDNSTLKSIITTFLKITIFQVKDNGDVEKVLINSQPNLKVECIDNIYRLFVPEDSKRVEGLINYGIDSKRKFVQIKTECGFEGYVDVETHFEKGKIYICLRFFDSNREREVLYERQLEDMTRMAELDYMTGLHNRFGYWEKIRRILTCGDDERRLGIIFLDVDRLKQINDTYGHNMGDKAIQQFSDLITKTIRKRDIAVRYGGDEFVIVVEELSGKKSSAYGLATRLWEKIQKNRKKYLTTLSIGVHIVKVGEFNTYLEDEKELKTQWSKAVKAADSMAYKSKKNGKNQVTTSFDI